MFTILSFEILMSALLAFVSFFLYWSAHRFFSKKKLKPSEPTSFYFKLKRKCKGAFFITSTASITFINLFFIFLLIDAIENQSSGANSVKLLTKNVLENKPVIKSAAKTKRDADYEDWKKDYEKGG